MKLYEKKYKYSSDIEYKGTKRGFSCTIKKSSNEKWFFYFHNENRTISYNSTWYDLTYDSVEEAREECEKYIIKIIKEK